jgi:hypothetical protein
MRIERALPLATLLLGIATSAVAAPLDPQACAALKTEYDGLVSAGVKSDMDRGPDWAKTNNLAPDRLGKIERLMALQEQLSFRCGEQLTARPNLKEPPKPPQPEKTAKDGKNAAAAAPTGDLLDSLMAPSNIPPPKKKSKNAQQD